MTALSVSFHTPHICAIRLYFIIFKTRRNSHRAIGVDGSILQIPFHTWDERLDLLRRPIQSFQHLQA